MGTFLPIRAGAPASPPATRGVASSAPAGREATLAPSDAEFVRFVEEIETDLVRTTRRLAPAGVDPQDLAAEALARAYARWGQLGQAEYRRAWVFRVVTNLALSAHAAGRRRALSLQRWAPAPRADRVDEEVVDRELLRSALRRLPARQREAVALHYFADLPVAEVARTMGIGTESAKTHVERGIAALRGALGGKLEGVLNV
jgi:RNA polymerase sigma-70 factor (ECF subfamily)